MNIRNTGWWGLITILITVWSCSNHKDTSDTPERIPPDIPLVQVADRTITVSEFIKRAEYTIRPPHCRGNLNIHKYIVLNSLIAEKLLAIELEDASVDTHFMKYLIGRKEQKMRDVLFYEKAYKLVSIDTVTTLSTADAAVRTYDIRYTTFRDPTQAQQFYELLINGSTFEDINQSILHLDRIPTRKVKYLEETDPYICNALFGSALDKDQIVGPVRTSDGNYLIMQVDGWVSQISLSPEERTSFIDRVSEKLKTDHAMIRYNEYVSGIMSGKEMKLIEDTFREFVEVVRDHYLASQADKEDMVQLTLWQEEKKSEREDEPPSISYNRNMPLLELDGKTWNLKDIEQLVESHPLVFRKKRIKPQEFSEQLKFTLADLFRDFYLTQEAYQLGYDLYPTVLQEVAMWTDSYNANFARDQILSDAGIGVVDSNGTLKAIETYLNPHIAELQQMYSDQILINLEQFNAIQLTSVDMLAITENAPYPVIVPDFPLLTTLHELNYGKAMDLK